MKRDLFFCDISKSNESELNGMDKEADILVYSINDGLEAIGEALQIESMSGQGIQNIGAMLSTMGFLSSIIHERQSIVRQTLNASLNRP
ncbi:hypothetical protein [Limnobaculum xujianqingii]|uniref:hypothetical protein n=1 Tax=Limnobaculum xujianqingii TaxID=2738837 RepID=UPI00112E23FA|nr:hypothetical protein [Limnobaculum xujianqingii]